MVALLLLPLPGFGASVPPVQGPRIDRIEPNTVATSGDTRIVILGSGFDTSESAPVHVLVDGQPCSQVTVHSGGRITAMVPARAEAGVVDVEVRNSDGAAAQAPKALCYDDGASWLARWYRLKARVGTAWELMEQGGVIMLLLAILAFFGVAWALHCGLVVRSSQIMPKALLQALSGHISRHEIEQASSLCRKDGSVLSRIVLAVLRKSNEPALKLRELAQAAGSREASHLFQKINYLANIGVISPMLGLLGTVIGMLLAFKTIGMGEMGGRHILLAGAIYKALITSVAGLTIGIPAMACFYYFRGKLLRITTDMEQVTEDVVEAVAAAGEVE